MTDAEEGLGAASPIDRTDERLAEIDLADYERGGDDSEDRSGGSVLSAGAAASGGQGEGTDPLAADTDGDGTADGVDKYPLVGYGAVAAKVVATLQNLTVQYAKGMYLGEAGNIEYVQKVFSVEHAEVNAIESDPWVEDTDGDGIPDGADARPTDPSASDGPDSQTQLSRSDGKPTTAFKNGLVWGDWGYVHEYAGHETAAYIFGWILPYPV